jgi:hypothetical protein
VYKCEHCGRYHDDEDDCDLCCADDKEPSAEEVGLRMAALDRLRGTCRVQEVPEEEEEEEEEIPEESDEDFIRKHFMGFATSSGYTYNFPEADLTILKILRHGIEDYQVRFRFNDNEVPCNVIISWGELRLARYFLAIGKAKPKATSITYSAGCGGN